MVLKGVPMNKLLNGECDEALQLPQMNVETEVLDVETEALDVEYYNIAVSKYRLALKHSYRCEYEEALELLNESYETMCDIKHPKDPNALTVHNEMGRTLYFQGKFDDALSILEEVLEYRTDVLGKKDWNTLYSEYLVLCCLIGKGEEVLPMLEELYRSYKEINPVDELTLNMLDTIGQQKLIQGKFDEALEINARFFEEENIKLLSEFQILCKLQQKADIFKKQGRSTKALTIMMYIYTTLKVILGEDHKKTLSTGAHVLNHLIELKRYDEAYTMLEECFKKQEAADGYENPRTLLTHQNMAVLLFLMDKHDEALRIFNKTYAAMNEIRCDINERIRNRKCVRELLKKHHNELEFLRVQREIAELSAIFFGDAENREVERTISRNAENREVERTISRNAENREVGRTVSRNAENREVGRTISRNAENREEERTISPNAENREGEVTIYGRAERGLRRSVSRNAKRGLVRSVSRSAERGLVRSVSRSAERGLARSVSRSAERELVRSVSPTAERELVRSISRKKEKRRYFSCAII